MYYLNCMGLTVAYGCFFGFLVFLLFYILTPRRELIPLGPRDSEKMDQLTDTSDWFLKPPKIFPKASVFSGNNIGCIKMPKELCRIECEATNGCEYVLEQEHNCCWGTFNKVGTPKNTISSSQPFRIWSKAWIE